MVVPLWPSDNLKCFMCLLTKQHTAFEWKGTISRFPVSLGSAEASLRLRQKIKHSLLDPIRISPSDTMPTTSYSPFIEIRNYTSILYCFWATASYLSKICACGSARRQADGGVLGLVVVWDITVRCTMLLKKWMHQSKVRWPCMRAAVCALRHQLQSKLSC